MSKNISDLNGVYSAAINCGIKKDKLDLCYIYVPQAYSSAAVFTKNQFCAPCVTRNRKALKQAVTKAIIINSGNANVMTGPEGIESTERSAIEAADLLKIKPEEVLTASTGIIGVRFPIEKLSSGLKKLLIEPNKKDGAITAEAILTTDLVKKEVFVEKKVAAGSLQLAGIAKGSGMIAPNMATMLAFLVTNAKITSAQLQTYLAEAVNDSFNMVSVDTDTSTSDQVIVISTGELDLNDSEINEFKNLLNSACIDLAKKIARDGEGATKLIEVCVNGANSDADARKIARNIAESPLVKTAIHGSDPNWGRVIMAVGKDPSIKLNPDNLDLSFQGEAVLKASTPVGMSRDNLRKLLQSEIVKIEVNLNLGNYSAKFWSCDLTKGYIDINTDYN